MNCLVAVINGFVSFSTGVHSTALDFCDPVNMIRVIMSWWEIDIESLSAVHDKACTMKLDSKYNLLNTPCKLKK